jgi:hypothetical protein
MALERSTIGTSQQRELVREISQMAARNNWDARDLLTVISYETAGKFDPWQAGPTNVRQGQPRGLIQWIPENQKRYNVNEKSSLSHQVKQIETYLKDRGVKPGDGILPMYAAINAGDARKTGATDANNGGAPGTVRDKVEKQMGGHRRNAEALIEKYGTPADLPNSAIGYNVSPTALAQPTLPPIDGMTRQAYYRDKNFNPIATPASRLSGLMTPMRPGIPERAPRQVSAAPASDFRAAPPKTVPPSATQFGPGPALRNQTPVLNPSAIQRMQDNLTSKMAFARPNPSNMNISGYGFSTPAKPSGPQATGSATGNINRASAVGNLAVPGRSPGVLGGRGNINPPNVVSPPANNLPAFDENGRWTGGANLPQRGPNVSTWGAVANAPVVQAPSQQAALGPTNDPSVRAAQADLAKSNRRDQFARDLIRSMPAPTPTVNVDRGRFAPQASAAELANQYSQYGRGTVPSAQINPSVFDMVDVPQSRTIADQYASYGAGKIAPQVASSATQSVPAMPNIPQTVGPRSPTVQAPTVNAPMTQQQRMDKALADMRVGIPPKDIYKEQLGVPVAPANPVFGNGFRGFGAGGFLGNLLTGNLRSAASIPGGFQLPGVLGIIQNAVQRLGGPQQAAQAVQTVAPALGQVMGLPAAQQAAKAGNNMVIGRDANGILGWMADGGLSAGAANAGWASNNPERNYGGYGGGYDPTPV